MRSQIAQVIISAKSKIFKTHWQILYRQSENLVKWELILQNWTKLLFVVKLREKDSLC